MVLRAAAATSPGKLAACVGGIVALHTALLVADLWAMLVVVPSFTVLFAELGSTLPTYTVLVISLVGWTRRFWWLVVLLGFPALATDVAVHVFVGHRRGLSLCAALGVLVAALLLLAPALGMLGPYLPLFILVV